MGKYDPLYERLARAAGEKLTLTFGQIDELVQGLPPSARKHQAWWNNESAGSHIQARAWMGAGWTVDEVDRRAERVTFRRA